MDQRKSKLFSGLYCFAGFAFCFAAYYPGFMSVDSFEQYTQVITQQYGDWHPPIMAGWWSVLYHLHKGPQPMLVFQLLCLWISVYLLMTLIQKTSWKIFIVLFSLAPFVQNIAGYIIKDANMALPWLLASSILLHYTVRDKKIPVVISILIFLLLTYGCWVRTNAFPGVWPLVIWWIFYVMKERSRIIKISTTVVVLIFLSMGHWIQDTVFDTDEDYAEYKLYMEDITGIYAKTGINYYPPSFYNHKGFDSTLMKLHYTPATFDDEWENDPMISVPEGTDSTAPPAKLAWIKAIKEHPFVYLQNRLEGYVYYLRIKHRSPFQLYYPFINKNRLGFHLSPNPLRKIFISYIDNQAGAFYMRPWFWSFLNFILLFFIPLLKNEALRNAYIALLLSGIFYQLLMLLVFPIDTEFRYFYWNCIAESVAVGLLMINSVNPVY